MQSRGSFNLLFWLLWFSGVVWLLWAAPDNIEARVSLLVGFAALWINLYPRFIQGPKLICAAHQITILSIPAGNQLPVLIEIALADLLSEHPSQAALNLIGGEVGLRRAVDHKNSAYIAEWFQANPPREGVYVPPDNLIRKFLHDTRTTPTFFIPLFVYNAGAKHAEIASVLMFAELTTNRARKWAYAAYMELDESKLIHIDRRAGDLDKFSATFAGHIIKPNDSSKLNLYFVPHHEVLGQRISTTSLVAGDYDLRIIGLDRKDRRVLTTVMRNYPLAEDTLLGSFKSQQWTFYAGVDRNILKLMGNAG